MITSMKWLENDLLSALGRCFPNLDASNGWVKFFEKAGVSIETLEIYIRMGMHCSLQSCFTQCEPDLRRRIVSGAIGVFNKEIEGYQFEPFYNKLERALAGEKVFTDQISILSGSFLLQFLPKAYENVALAASKMLVEEFVSKSLPEPNHILDQFESFLSGIGASISLVQRAHNNVSRDLKL